MRLIAALFGAALAFAGVQAAHAAPSVIGYAVVSQPTLDALGITYSASGGATLDSSGPVPVVTMAVTGAAPIAGGELIASADSVIAADIGAAMIGMTDFVLNTALGLLFGDLTVDPDGAPPPVVYNGALLATVLPNGDVLLSAFVGELLASAGLPGAEGFLVANIVTPVPAPGALALFGLGLALLGAAGATGRSRA
jgi:hypothetical protein